MRTAPCPECRRRRIVVTALGGGLRIRQHGEFSPGGLCAGSGSPVAPHATSDVGYPQPRTVT